MDRVATKEQAETFLSALYALRSTAGSLTITSALPFRGLMYYNARQIEGQGTQWSIKISGSAEAISVVTDAEHKFIAAKTMASGQHVGLWVEPSGIGKVVYPGQASRRFINLDCASEHYNSL